MRFRLNFKAQAAILSIATACTLITLTSSTFAWYLSKTVTTTTFTGTAFRTSQFTEFGIDAGDTVLFNASAHGFKSDEAEEIDGHRIYWVSNSRDREESAKATNYYLNCSGYASTLMSPVTSGKHDGSEQVKLYDAPKINEFGYGTEMTDAPINKYAKLPIVFRVSIQNGPNETDTKLQEGAIIHLQKATSSKVTPEKNVEDAVRLSFSSVNEGKSIYRPYTSSNGNANGQTIVGGPLNLQRDEYFDYKDNHEIIYGQFNDGSVASLDNPLAKYSDTPYDSDIPTTTEITSFSANHKKGVYTCENQVSDFATAHYLCNDTIYGTNSTPICYTDNHGLAYTTLTTWLEGWDKSIIDANANAVVSIDVNFITEIPD